MCNAIVDGLEVSLVFLASGWDQGMRRCRVLMVLSILPNTEMVRYFNIMLFCIVLINSKGSFVFTELNS